MTRSLSNSILCLVVLRGFCIEVSNVSNIPFFTASGQRNIHRHALNDRKQAQVLQEYKDSVRQRGVVREVRGKAWMQAPNIDKGEIAYKALTFGTLRLGMYQVNWTRFGIVSLACL